jgi:HK97 gp10 family phage protein
MAALTLKYETWLDAKGVREAVKQASVGPLERCALWVDRKAKRSMKKGGGERKVPSPKGKPPHVQTGNLKASIQIAPTQRHTYVVGPTLQAWYGKLHEFGLGKFPKRPVMRPALQTTKNRFPRLFKEMGLANTRAGRRLNARKRK